MDIKLTDILFQIVNFSAVLGALIFLLYKPILNIFAERAKKIEEGQKAAQTAIDTQEKSQRSIDKSKKENDQKMANLYQEAVTEAKKQKQAVMDQAQTEAKAYIKKAKEDWGKEKKNLLQQAQKDMVEAVIAVSSKVIGRELTEKKHSQLITKELNTLLT